VLTGQDDVRGERTDRYRVELPITCFHPSIQKSLISEDPQGAVETNAIEVIVWLDSQLRIRRLSFESHRGNDALDSLWSITEFYDFGAGPTQFLREIHDKAMA